MNEIGSGLWSVDWTNGECVLVCAESYGARCGGLAEEKELLLDPKSCCEANFFWIYPEFGEVSIVVRNGFHLLLTVSYFIILNHTSC